MHPSLHARTDPDKAALVVASTGAQMTYAELDAASNRVAHWLRAQGLQAGATIALMLENRPEFFAIAWGAQRAGLFYVCISTRLTSPEADYILADSGARLLIADATLAQVVSALASGVERYAVGGPIAGFADWSAAVNAMPATPIADERAGADMLYSSGTTGRPKGVRVALPENPAIDEPTPLVQIARSIGLSANSIYLSPAPLYHAAPLRWCMAVHRVGGTVVMMDHFEAQAALDAVQRYGCNASQWVPTHFIRMLKLPDDVRAAYDLSTMRLAIHAAAPCPVPVKRAMIDWWGPVIVEYYAGSEGNGMTMVGTADWLQRPGTVGRAIFGTLHVCDEDGEPVPAGVEGTVFFEGGGVFAYHNDADKTAEAANRHGWTTLGDVGWMNDEGFLFLTDRKSFMIISGGVNIYPQEIENHLAVHPDVADVAVVGAPDPDMGEQVVAVVQPAQRLMDDADADALRARLTAWCREALSGVKVPRRIDFTDELPRHPTGKLYKRLIRDRYWGKGETRIV